MMGSILFGSLSLLCTVYHTFILYLFSIFWQINSLPVMTSWPGWIYTPCFRKKSTYIVGYKLRNSCLILIIFDVKIPHII